MNTLGLSSIAASLLILSLGLLVFSKQAESQPRRIFAWFCFAIFGWFFFYGLMELHTPYQLLFAKLGHSSVLFVPVTYVHFVMYFLNLPRLRPIIRAYYIVAIMSLLLLHATDWLIAGVKTHPWGIYPTGGILMALDASLVTIAASYCWIMFVVRCRQLHRTGPPEEYNRLKYGCIAMTSLSLGALDYIPKLFNVDFYPPGWITTTIFAVIFTYAILKRHLLDLNIAIRRTAVYSILGALITASYLVVVLITEHWFKGVFGYRSLIATAVTGFAIAIGFIPAKNRVQGFVDRYFFHRSQFVLEEENEQLKKHVERTERLKAVTALAAGMAHEIKNPLASIKTFAEYLPQKYNDPVFREKFAKIMSMEVDKMNTLVQRLLEFARPTPPQLQPVYASQLLQETLEFLQGTLVKQHITIETEFAETDSVLVDPGQMKQVFLNVLLNSIEAMDPPTRQGGGMNQPGRLSVATQQHNGYVEVKIADTGPGIPKKDLQRVFDPFYTTKANGTGLGLSVVHSIVREHGGRVVIHSEPGEGTTVAIHLPRTGGTNGTSTHPHCG